MTDFGSQLSQLSASVSASLEQIQQLLPALTATLRKTGPVVSTGNEIPDIDLNSQAKTVIDVWNEWNKGYKANPPLRELERKHGTLWRRGRIAKSSQRRKKVVDFIENEYKMHENILENVDVVVRDLEEYRKQSGKGLFWLYGAIPPRLYDDAGVPVYKKKDTDGSSFTGINNDANNNDQKEQDSKKQDHHAVSSDEDISVADVAAMASMAANNDEDDNSDEDEESLVNSEALALAAQHVANQQRIRDQQRIQNGSDNNVGVNVNDEFMHDIHIDIDADTDPALAKL